MLSGFDRPGEAHDTGGNAAVTSLDPDTNRRGVRARGRAMTRLARNHRVEYRELLTEERAKEGLPPALPLSERKLSQGEP